ncbi:MAG: DEAD/DEAH box helicase family protein [Rhodomicrobium sp.]|nr:DEAD/DEAH box helicase family protein [Rhodomicrobium sp.]
MDLRLKAFESPEFDRVFGAVASLAGAADEERLDVPEIEADADEALSAITSQALSQNPDPASRILLIKGATGTGKTHTLLTAIRRMHQDGRVYAALFPMVDLVAEKDLDAWLLRALISRLSERYLVAAGAPSPLNRLAGIILAQGQPELSSAFQREVFGEGGDIRDFDLRPLIVSIRTQLQKLSHLPVPSEAFIAALLGAAAGEDDSFAYLRGQSANVSIGGVRLTQFAEDHVARGHIDALVNVIGATGGALLIAFDQLEQSRVQGWEQRLRHLFSRGALLAETLPPLCVAYAVLPALYDTIADGIDGSIRDRI